MFVVMAGLPASGKSTIAKKMRDRLNSTLLDKDEVRQCLFGQYTEYSREQDDLCMETIYSTADFLVRKHPDLTILLDGRTYSRAYQVEAVLNAAAKAGTNIKFIECICSEISAKRRLDNAVKENLHLAADRNFDLYRHSKANAESVPEPKLVIDTDAASVEVCTQLAIDYLSSVS